MKQAMDGAVAPDGWCARIKAATKALVREAGGLKAAEQITGRSDSQIQRWYALDASDTIPISCVLALESFARKPLVSQAMAEIQGYRLLPMQDGGGDDHFLAATATLMAESAEVQQRTAEAIKDGVVTLTEAGALENALHDQAEATARKRNVIAQAVSGGRAIKLVP